MKNTLLLNYNIDIDEIQKINDNMYTFFVDYIKFYFVKINRPKKDVVHINNLLSNTFNKFHYIIKNVSGNLSTSFENKEFILLKVNGPENNELSLNDILSEQFSVDKTFYPELSRTNWGELWAQKVDYLEYQVSELGQDHYTVRSSFSYYIGLAENAIQYFNILEIKHANLFVSHRRIMYPNFSVNYYNPLNIVIDYRVRDIAEYLKFSFFKGNFALNDLICLVNKNVLNSIEYNLLYARLLFPSYYFDLVTDILEGKRKDEELISYIEKISEYELFLKQSYELISKKSNLMKIDWIINK